MLTDQPHLIRQSGLIPSAALRMPVTIIGCGAIGSHVALQLAKMGLEDISVWDHDVVSIENMSCQGFRFADIGHSKALALRDIVHDFTRVTIKANISKWIPTPLHTKGIVILAVDCMEAREQIWLSIIEKHFNVKWVIDARMGAEAALMYVMNPFDDRDRDSYRKTLYKNEDAVQEACTAKSTIYTANLISGWISKAVKNLINKQPYPRVTTWSIRENAMQVYTG